MMIENVRGKLYMPRGLTGEAVLGWYSDPRYGLNVHTVNYTIKSRKIDDQKNTEFFNVS